MASTVSQDKFIKIMDYFGKKWASFVGGFVNTAIGMIKRASSSAYGIAQSFDAMSVATSRNIGLTYRDNIAYTQTLISRTKDLAAAYGIAAGKVAALQDNVAKATHRAILLSNTQAESVLAITKVLGDQTAVEYQNKVINSLGGSVAAAMNVAQDAYTRASRMGLSAAEYSTKIAQNLTLVNTLHFRNGVDGLTKMTALSERLGFNMQSLSSVADKFSNIETALPSAAALQALGGSFSVYGANPLSWMYASMGDAEQLTKMVSDLVKGLSTFNKQTGIAELGIASKQYLRAAAPQLGMSYDELANIANRQATEQFARARVGNLFDTITEGDEEFKNYILNKIQWNDKVQKFELTNANGKTIDIEALSKTKEGIDALKEEWKQSTMSDREAFIDAAQRITSFQERLEGINSMIGAMLAQKLMPFLELAKTFLFNNLQALTSIAAKGVSLLTNPKFWLSIGKDIAALTLGGLASIVQNAVMWLLGPIGKGVQLLGWVLDAIGFATNTDWVETIGKWLDGRGLGAAMYKGVNSVLDAMAPTTEADAQIASAINEVALLGKTVYKDVTKAWEVASKNSIDSYNTSLNAILESKKGERVYTKDAQLESIDHRLATIALSSAKQAEEQVKGNKLMAQATATSASAANTPTTQIASVGLTSQINDDNRDGDNPLAAAIGIAGFGVPLYLGKRAIKNKVRNIFVGKPTLPTAVPSRQMQISSTPPPTRSIPRGLLLPSSYQVEQHRSRVSSKPFARPSGKSVGQLRNMVKMRVPMARRGVEMLGGMRGIGTGLGLGLGGAAINMGTNALVDRGTIRKYGVAHYGGSILGKGLEYAAMGSFFGPIGAAIGGLAGATMGAVDVYRQKSREEQADKQRVSSIALSRLGISQIYTQSTDGYVPSSPYAAAFGSPQVSAQPTTGSQRYITPTSSIGQPSSNHLDIGDININVSGTIRLEGGTNSRGIDLNNLMKDQAFVTQIKDLIKDSINKGMNNGRSMHDASSIGGGLPKQVYANV